MNQQISITANGKAAQVPENSLLSDFLETRGLALGRVVVERNGEALTPGEAGGAILQPGDRLEIVCIVAGG